MKTLFGIITALGVILAFGVVGTCDLEMATGAQMMSLGQLILRLFLTFALTFGGWYGGKHFSPRSKAPQEDKRELHLFVSGASK